MIIKNKHYILIDLKSRIIDGWSDGPCPEKDINNSICISNNGSYQFRLFDNGEENTPLFNINGVPKYKWDGEKVILRPQEEIKTDEININKK